MIHIYIIWIQVYQSEQDHDRSKHGWITAKISYNLKSGQKSTVLVEILQLLFARNTRMFRNCSIKLKITIQELLMITKKQKLRNFNQDCSFWAELEMVTDFGCNSAILWMITLKLRLHRLFAYFILYMQHIFTDKHATDWRLQHFGESRNYCWDQPMLCLPWKKAHTIVSKVAIGPTVAKFLDERQAEQFWDTFRITAAEESKQKFNYLCLDFKRQLLLLRRL